MARPSILEGALESLSDIQRQAARHDDGALIVLAGPGSGKTQVLATRAARLLHESPDRAFRVLALTFTNRAADEMRHRIEKMAPEAEHRLFVGTFHAFSAGVLRLHGQHLGIRTDFRVFASSEDREVIARRAIASDPRIAGLEERADDFLELIDRAKTKLIPGAGIAQFFKDAARGAAFEIFYGAYDAALKEANALDLASLISNAHLLFRRFDGIARRYRSAYRYWCVDEFQDTNFGQYELLKVMAGVEFRNVFAVADDDQIIYQWNGADHRRLDQFRADFGALLQQIPTNYRCPVDVVTCANKLISCNMLRTADKKPLISGRDSSGRPSVIEVLSWSTDKDEALGVAQHIAGRPAGVLEQIAVLTRWRRLLDPIAVKLTEFGIQSQVIVRRDEFQSAAFRWLHRALRLGVHNTDERALQACVRSFNEMFSCAISAADIIARSHDDRVDLLTGWDRAVRQQVDSPDALAMADTVVQHLRGNVDYVSFAAAVITVLDRWFSDEAHDDRERETLSALRSDRAAWDGLCAEVGTTIGVHSDPERFLQELDLRSKEPPVSPDAVALMTIHSAKGSEFDHVYLAGLVEDVLPSFQSKKEGDRSPEFEEERRNCFVAVTRCRQALTLSYAAVYSGWSKAPSRFLKEMGLLRNGST
ncbi:MAG: ATP-dependent helicase [Spirochaetaceae bacterium]|nr:ATP-dependent helicase [Spirochaetaceae bacterium]